MQDILKEKILEALEELEIGETNFVVEATSDSTHGDYFTNVALVVSKKLGENPRELAERIKSVLEEQKIEYVEKIEIAGAGFINFFLKPEYYVNVLKKIIESPEKYGHHDTLAGKKVMIEYTDPNPFKEFHIGHLMSNSIGESLSRIFEASGARVLRANYFGDVGIHVAKAIWGKMHPPAGESELSFAKAYVYGNEKYESDENCKAEITALNKKIYARSDNEINKLYDEGKSASLAEFEKIYKRLGTKFDRYYPESEVAEVGIRIVNENVPQIFEKSEGATVFKAEKFDENLHTRVFINKEGLPTYEAKELGLAKRKFEEENPDFSIVITGNEIKDYYRVVMKALSLINDEWASKNIHMPHGMLRFASGKMGSRMGNVITGESLISDVEKLALEKMAQSTHLSDEEKSEVATEIAVGAIKYSILKQAIGKDIIFDFEKSLSFEGDSGPYLQYTFARTQSVLEKAKEVNLGVRLPSDLATGMPSEVERRLERFPAVVKRALAEYSPQLIATYLIELASEFNSYYAQNQIINLEDKETSEYRLALTKATGAVLKNGLWLLGIKSPERM